MQYTLKDYQSSTGDIPYVAWLQALRDVKTRARIAMTVARMEKGNFGDSKSVGPGLLERKLDFGPGYRVYYARYPEYVVILFCGGDKSTQAEDIAKAKEYKEDYESRCL